jgi:hypothetical protein
MKIENMSWHVRRLWKEWWNSALHSEQWPKRPAKWWRHSMVTAKGTLVKKKFVAVPAWYGDVLDLLSNNCDFRFFCHVFIIFYGLNKFFAWRWIACGECVMKNQMINVNKTWKLISYRKAIVLMILIKRYIFCMVKIMIIIYIMLNIYTVKLEFRLQIFLVYNNAKQAPGICFIILWLIFYLLGN